GNHRDRHSFPTRRSSDLVAAVDGGGEKARERLVNGAEAHQVVERDLHEPVTADGQRRPRGDAHHGGKPASIGEAEVELRVADVRSEEHTSELQSLAYLVC